MPQCGVCSFGVRDVFRRAVSRLVREHAENPAAFPGLELSPISLHAAPAVPKPALRGSGSGHCTAHCAPQVPPAPPCTGQDYNPQKTLFSFFFFFGYDSVPFSPQ